MRINEIEIKLVLWDVDGTILNFFEAQKNAIRACFDKFDLGECDDEMLSIYDGINHKYWKALERGEITKPQVLTGRFHEFFTMYGINTDVVEDFNNEYQIRLGDTICFYDGVMDVIQRINKAGIPQFAVTNGTKVAQDKKLSKSGLDKIFDSIFISEVVGAEKPSKDFFIPVWERAKELASDITLDDIIIIGDSMTSDMQLGKNVGIKTCLFAPASSALAAGIQSTQDAGVNMMIAGFDEIIITD